MRFNTELLALYKNAPLRYKFYSIVRYMVCPFAEIEKYIPFEGRILDCGCGHGIFVNLLALKSSNRDVIGIDFNEDKIKAAISTLSGRENIKFMVGDMQEDLNLKDIKCIVLIDMLYHISFDKKKGLLKKLYNILQINGMVIIKSIQEFPRWKYWWTRFHIAIVDKLFYGDFKGSPFFLKKEEYLNLLKELGFEVKFKDMGKGYPYSHCLYICTKVHE